MSVLLFFHLFWSALCCYVYLYHILVASADVFGVGVSGDGRYPVEGRVSEFLSVESSCADGENVGF